jgi:hypothetical protein
VNQTDFSFEVADDCPNEHSIIFQLNIISDEDEWILFFSLQSFAPYIQVIDIQVVDGNNSILDPGESGEIHLQLQNIGGAEAPGLAVEISTTDPFISFTTTNFNIGNLGIGSTSEIIIEANVILSAPLQHEIMINIESTTSTNFSSQSEFSIFIAQVPVAFFEDFSTFPQAGWTIENIGPAGTGWSLNPSNAAGGNPPEGACICADGFNYDEYLISPVINTLGSIELNLEYRSGCYENLRNYNLYIKTTDDGINWHTAWSHTGQSMNPHIEYLTINTPDVGSATFQLAFVLEGAPTSIIAWVVDDISINEITVEPHGYAAGYVTLANGNSSVEDVTVSAAGIMRNPDENGFYLLPIPAGTYDVSASLPGYITEVVTDIEIINWQTSSLDFNLEEVTINNPPLNLIAETSYNDVTLTWDMPGTEITRISQDSENSEENSRERSLVGYNIYRNNEVIDQINDITIIEYDDIGLNAGNYSYYITAIYDEGESDPSNSVDVTITLAPPTDLTAQVTGPGMVLLQWDAPLPSARGFQNYRVYRDLELIADDVLQTFYFNINVPNGLHTYAVSCVYDGYESDPATINVEVTEVGNNPVPSITQLDGNYPNPFNPTTTIKFSLKEESFTTLEIFNLKGEKVITLVDEKLTAAKHSVCWNGKDDSGKQVSSGIYLYRMVTDHYSATKKMIMLK